MEPRTTILEVKMAGDIVVVIFKDKKIYEIGNQLFVIFIKSKKKILIDFNNVDYVFEDALGELATFNRCVKESGGQVVFCNINSQTLFYERLKTTRLDEYFSIVKDKTEGLCVLSS